MSQVSFQEYPVSKRFNKVIMLLYQSFAKDSPKTDFHNLDLVFENFLAIQNVCLFCEILLNRIPTSIVTDLVYQFLLSCSNLCFETMYTCRTINYCMVVLTLFAPISDMLKPI